MSPPRQSGPRLLPLPPSRELPSGSSHVSRPQHATSSPGTLELVVSNRPGVPGRGRQRSPQTSQISSGLRLWCFHGAGHLSQQLEQGHQLPWSWSLWVPTPEARHSSRLPGRPDPMRPSMHFPQRSILSNTTPLCFPQLNSAAASGGWCLGLPLSGSGYGPKRPHSHPGGEKAGEERGQGSRWTRQGRYSGCSRINTGSADGHQKETGVHGRRTEARRA